MVGAIDAVEFRRQIDLELLLIAPVAEDKLSGTRSHSQYPAIGRKIAIKRILSAWTGNIFYFFAGGRIPKIEFPTIPAGDRFPIGRQGQAAPGSGSSLKLSCSYEISRGRVPETNLTIPTR